MVKMISQFQVTKIIDVELIYNYLHDEAYWSRGIPLRLVEKSIQNSICFGVFGRILKRENRNKLDSEELLQIHQLSLTLLIYLYLMNLED
jgi:TnpA family transposase